MENQQITSFWHDSTKGLAANRQKLETDIQADIAIIGAGYSGLWTAYYLKKLNPTMNIVVIEGNQIGFGASGRNGGWCSGFLPTSIGELEALHGRPKAVEMYKHAFSTITEISDVLKKENIACDFQQGGTLHGATNAVQQSRVEAEVNELHDFGFAESDIRRLSASEAKSHINLDVLKMASFTPHCAVVHPAKLIHGLAVAVERLGVKIYENSPVSHYEPKLIKCNNLQVKADVVVRATEGFTRNIKRQRRTLAPLYSYMVATEPLNEIQLKNLGWKDRVTYHDARNMIIYSQLTIDNRIAFGGRGAPYHFASRVKAKFDTHEIIHEKIIKSMRQAFPQIHEAQITHRWGGPLGVPRNWHPSANFDPSTGLASLGGYVGDGVGASNLAARTLAHLITQDSHPLTELAWANYSSRKWEIEPLRYFAINGLLKMSESIDKHESATNRPDKLRSKILEKFVG